MAGQAEVDAVPDIGELGVMVDLLRVERDARQEAERLAEVLEREAAHQRLAAFFQRPAVGNLHDDSPVLHSSFSHIARRRVSQRQGRRCKKLAVTTNIREDWALEKLPPEEQLAGKGA